jgi:hypothetical protein
MVEDKIQQLKELYVLLTEDEQEVLLASIALYARMLNTAPMVLEDRLQKARAGKSLLFKIGQQLIEKPQEK